MDKKIPSTQCPCLKKKTLQQGTSWFEQNNNTYTGISVPENELRGSNSSEAKTSSFPDVELLIALVTCVGLWLAGGEEVEGAAVGEEAAGWTGGGNAPEAAGGEEVAGAGGEEVLGTDADEISPSL